MDVEDVEGLLAAVDVVVDELVVFLLLLLVLVFPDAGGWV